MKKNGFTLTEVLITLGIIGVVAALTAPGLILRTTQDANTAKLSVMVANIENSLTAAIAAEGVDGLDELNDWSPAENSTNFVGNIGRLMHIAGAKTTTNNNQTTTISYSTYYGDTLKMENTDLSLFSGNNVTAAPIQTKNGCTLFIHKDNHKGVGDTIIRAGGSLTHKAANVVIDVNGTEGPNTPGVDIFGFYLSNDAILYPIGGSDVSLYEANKGQGQSVTYSNDMQKTATVVENGYKSVKTKTTTTTKT